MGLINVFFIRSKMVSLVRAYFGALIFTLYLLFDFNRLEKKAGDESWATAINISVNIYLDIINLFLDLLEILSETD
jgi:FtsH-binding integral membrane protein